MKIEGEPLNTQHAQHRPGKTLADESLALCHFYLQQRCNVYPHHPACAQQNGENFPFGAESVILRFVLEEAVANCATVVMLCA